MAFYFSNLILQTAKNKKTVNEFTVSSALRKATPLLIATFYHNLKEYQEIAMIFLILATASTSNIFLKLSELSDSF